MAGTSGPDPAKFRAAIRTAMTLGAPPTADDQATFFFPQVVAVTGAVDGEGVPMRQTQVVARTPRVSVKVPVAIKFVDDPGRPTDFGIASPGAVVLTLLDEDYEAVKGFEFVAIAGVRYDYRRTQPPTGMGQVAVYKVHAVAVDVS